MIFAVTPEMLVRAWKEIMKKDPYIMFTVLDLRENLNLNQAQALLDEIVKLANEQYPSSGE